MTMDLSFLLASASVPTPPTLEPDLHLAELDPLLDPLAFLEVEVPPGLTDADVAEVATDATLEVAPADAEQLAREARERLDEMKSDLLWFSVKRPTGIGTSILLGDMQATAMSLSGQSQRDFVAANQAERAELLNELANVPKGRAEVAKLEAEIDEFRLKVERMESGVAASKAALAADAAEAQARRARYAAQFGGGNE